MIALRLYDCFPFFNELDLLEIRLQEVSDVVEAFVLVEARQTFSGKPKPLYYEENKDRFADYADKIIHVVIDAFPPSRSKWDIEHFQRDELRRGLKDARPDDLILLSDVDEIPRRDVLARIKSDPPPRSEVLCLELRWFFFFVNIEHREKWLRIGPRVMRYARLTSFSGLRTNVRAPVPGMRDILRWLRALVAMRRPVKRRVVHNAGWHFTWLGGVDAVSRKAASIPRHTNRSYELEDKKLARKSIQNAIKGRGNGGTDLSIIEIDGSFPMALQHDPHRYTHLIYRPEDEI